MAVHFFISHPQVRAVGNEEVLKARAYLLFYIIGPLDKLKANRAVDPNSSSVTVTNEMFQTALDDMIIHKDLAFVFVEAENQ